MRSIRGSLFGSFSSEKEQFYPASKHGWQTTTKGGGGGGEHK
jgi:hypothetical protein